MCCSGNMMLVALIHASQIEVKRLLSAKPRCLEYNPGRILLHMSSQNRPECRKGENGAAGMEFGKLCLLVQIRSSKFLTTNIFDQPPRCIIHISIPPL